MPIQSEADQASERRGLNLPALQVGLVTYREAAGSAISISMYFL